MRRRLAVILILLALLGQGAAEPAGGVLCLRVGPAARPAHAAAPEGPGPASGAALVPVVLVHGLRGSGPSSWGEPASPGDPPSGIYLQLCRAGYEPGKTLFVCDYREDHLGDYRQIATRDLPAAIDLALAASGASQVDLVTRSMGGLVGRHYVTSPGYRGDVRTLVMIATPNRGSFGANILKSLEMINLQEQLRDRGAGHRSPSAYPVLPPQSHLVAAWRDEVSYVERQSRVVWEPLFGRYYAGAYLLAESSPGVDLRPPGFFDWLRSEYPGVARVLLDDSQRPPVQPSYLSARAGGFVGGTSPGPGESLTRAYYELLAIQCARHNFLAGRRLSPPETQPPPRPGNLLERAVAWLARLAAGQLGRVVRQRAQGLGLWALEHLTGLDPKGRATDCLIEETTLPSLGGPVLLSAGGDGRERVALPGSPEPGALPLVANYYLTEWNHHSAAQRAAPGRSTPGAGGDPPAVRYVHLAGQVPNLWGGLWPDVGANDLIVETASTWLPLGDDDAYHLFPSLVGTNHVWIGARGRPWQALIAALRDYYPVRASYSPPYRPGRSRLAEYTRRGQGVAQVYAPYYLELKLPAAGAAGARITYPPAAPTGSELTLRAWAYLDLPGEVRQRYPLEFRPGEDGAMTAGAEIPVAAAGARLLVGVRVEAAAGHQVAPPPNHQVRFAWELSFDPRGVADGSPGPSPAQGDPDRPPSGPPVQPAGPTVAGGVPVIRAVHRDRQTVYVEPVIHRHHRWEWTFGDGSTWTDAEPGRLTGETTHSYRQPGRYTCVARSLTASGQELARYEWSVEVAAGEAPAPRTFRATTLGEPAVDLQLLGPKAWVTGRPAHYRLTYEVLAGEGAVAEVVHLHPGREFQMIWDKPGRFVVSGALTLRLVYRDGGGLRSVTNVYVVQQEVRVYATVMTE